MPIIVHIQARRHLHTLIHQLSVDSDVYVFVFGLEYTASKAWHMHTSMYTFVVRHLRTTDWLSKRGHPHQRAYAHMIHGHQVAEHRRSANHESCWCMFEAIS
jgi:hypothetical protein